MLVNHLYRVLVFLVTISSCEMNERVKEMRKKGRTTLQVIWMVPGTTHTRTNFVHNASSSVAALALGLQKIKQEDILPEHDLKWVHTYLKKQRENSERHLFISIFNRDFFF